MIQELKTLYPEARMHSPTLSENLDLCAHIEVLLLKYESAPDLCGRFD